MSKTLKFPAGRAIAFTSGEYSDFSLVATVITLKDVDLAEQAQAFAASKRKEFGDDAYFHLEIEDLATWLITEGFAMAADIQNVHLGSYDCFEPEFGVKDPD